MAVRPRRLIPGRPDTAATFAIALVLLSTVGALLAQGAVRSRDRSTDRARIEADAARFEAGIDVVLARLGEIAAHAASDDAAFQSASRRVVDDDVLEVVLVADPSDLTVGALIAGPSRAPLVEGFGLGTVPGLTAAAEAATSAGGPRLVAPLAVDGEPTVLVVAPLVPASTPPDVASRRQATDRLVVGAVSLDRLRDPVGTIELWPGADVRLTTPTGVIGERPDGPTEDHVLHVGSTVWEVSVGPLAGHRRLLGWYVLTIGLVAALVVHTSMRRQQERQHRAERDATNTTRQLELIAGTSAALQQSLDLADLLPVFCVRVATEFELSATSVLIPDDEGQLVEAFRYGDPWPADLVAEFDLRRGLSSVGRLAVRSRRALDPLTTQSIQALSDLLAVAMGNAHLFLREQQAVARLSELDALKNAFLGTVSHELRTSTTAVLGFGELLTDHWDTLPDERRRQLASRIKRQAGSLRHLVDDLLDYARLEHKSLRVIPRELSLSDLVRQLTDSMSPLVADHQIVLDVDDEVVAWADPIAVERILANLLSNAGKYAPAGTVVTVGVKQQEGRARLSVADQGPGIPADERRRVFVRFYRLSNAETVRTRGAGIGLSILHDFAERSHADVIIREAVGGGALVLIDFPTEPVSTRTPTVAAP